MSKPPWRVAVIEDHPALCHAFVAAVGASQDMTVVGTAGDIDDGLALLQQERPQLLVVDLGLPSGSGLYLIREASRLSDGTCASAVLTMTGNEAHLFKAIHAGANGYLFKSDDPSAWTSGLRTLARGGGLLFGGLAGYLLRDTSTRLVIQAYDNVNPIVKHLAAGYNSSEIAAELKQTEPQMALHIRRCYAAVRKTGVQLAPREWELLHLLNQGYPFKQCALQMKVEETTVKTTAQRAYQKLDATNLPEALHAARREHFLR